VTSDLPPPAHDLRHLDPEVRKERVKLAANGVSALGLALLIGSFVAPIVDSSRSFEPVRIGLGFLFGGGLLLAAQLILPYMKPKESV
jgi:hypothetical protein